MLKANAIKKMKKLGPVYKGDGHDALAVKFNGNTLQVIFQQGRAIIFTTRRSILEADPIADFYPEAYHDNLTQAIRYAAQ